MCFTALRDLREARPVHAQSGGGFIPIASGWNIPSVTGGTSIFTTNLTLKTSASAIRISVVLATTSTFSIVETDGTHTFTSAMNSGTALTGGQTFTFVWGTRNSAQPGSVTQSGAGGATSTIGNVSGVTPSAINFSVGTTTAVPIIRVDELTSGVD